MTPKSIPRVLIPAAGFGKRAGLPEAKEMLIHPTTGMPLIASTFKICAERGWKPLVITRAEKKSLVEFSRSRGAEVLLVGPTREWPDTLLQSRDCWFEHNIVLLPDTEFEPQSAVDDLHCFLTEGAPCAFATFSILVNEGMKWGLLRETPNERKIAICEKPKEPDSNAKAWGFFGFQKNYGAELLSTIFTSSHDHQWKTISFDVQTLALKSFGDLTR